MRCDVTPCLSPALWNLSMSKIVRALPSYRYGAVRQTSRRVGVSNAKPFVFFKPRPDVVALHVGVVFSRVAAGALGLLKHDSPPLGGVREVSVFEVRAFDGAQRRQVFVYGFRVGLGAAGKLYVLYPLSHGDVCALSHGGNHRGRREVGEEHRLRLLGVADSVVEQIPVERVASHFRVARYAG